MRKIQHLMLTVSDCLNREEELREIRGCLYLCLSKLFAVLVGEVFSCSDVHEVSTSISVSNSYVFSEPLQF